MDIRTLAIIPARAGSRGIRSKNLVPLGGAPLLEYTLRAALEAAGIDRTVVSTDGTEIANLARDAGVDVVERPRALGGDRSPIIDAVLHALRVLAKEGARPERVVLLQPTSPFRTGHHIDEALQVFANSGTKSLISVCPVSQHPCDCVMERGDRLRPAVAPPRGSVGRQDYPEFFFVNGAIYITHLEMLRRGRRFWNSASAIYRMSAIHSIDIDNADQLAVAGALLATHPELAPLRRVAHGQQRAVP